MTAIPVLPEHPGLTAYSDLVGSLQLLNCLHVADFILAGRHPPFRVLDGVFVKSGSFSWQRADSSYLEQVRLDWHQDPDPRRRAAADHVIDLVQHATAIDPQALRQLALFQIRKLLHVPDKPDTHPGQLRAQVISLGVADDEADLLAVAVATARDAPRPDSVVELIAARRSNQLRRAARLAASLESTARDHVLLVFLNEIRIDDRRVDDLLAAGARLKDNGDLEEAAACYLQAAAIATDEPLIDEALQQCAPSPPLELTASVTGCWVTLRWGAAEASAGTITYRVTREAEPPSRVADGPETRAVDRDPPMGPAIAYRVVTVREGRVESMPAVTDSFRVLPDVENFMVTEQRGCMVGDWRVPPHVADVRATRHSGPLQGGSDHVAIQTGRTGFRDKDITAGTSYVYQVVCGYRDLQGGMAWSPGQVMSVCASRWPDPVTGLQLAAGPAGDTVCLQWISPGAGKVVIILGISAAPIEGSELAAADVEPLGTVAWQGAAAPAGSPMGCEIPVPGSGLCHLAVVTVLDRRAVIGATRVIDVLEGFNGLRARRAGNDIQLTWAWPASSPVTLATVRWDCPGEEAEASAPRRVSRDSYHRRGVLIPARGCGYRFTVTPLSAITGSVSVGPPATDELEPLHDLCYEVLRTRRWPRARRVVRLRVAERPEAPLQFLLVARPGTLRPTQIGQGTVVVRVSVGASDAGSPTEYPIELSAVRPPYYLLGFLTGSAKLQFRLIHPGRTQLLVER
jgi:hypothetical protein